MSYKVTFLDNEQYGAVDINNAISKIMTGGVAEVFFDGQSYNTSDLNKISQFIATYGVNPENNTTLKVIKEGTTSVKILAGTAFMNSGATITITGYEILPFVAGVKNYVYLKHDASLNSVKPYCTIIAGVGDIVPLAEVEVNGTVTDKRVYCKGKLAGYQNGEAIYDTVTLTTLGTVVGTKVNGTWYQVNSIPVKKSNYKYAAISSQTNNAYIYVLDAGGTFEYYRYYSWYMESKFVKNGNFIDVYVRADIDSSMSHWTTNFNYTIYFS